MATLIVDVPNTRARTRGGVPRPPPRPRIQLPTPALDAAPVIDTTGPVSNFVRTLYALAEGDYDDTQMEWIDGGDRILVADPKAFARDVCPRYYRHSKWTSFTRLMNMYNFRKCPAEEGTAFEHDYFKRGRAHDLHRVVRKRRGSDASPVVTPPPESHGDDASMAERVRAAPRIPAPQQILEPEQTTVVSFTDEDEAPTPAQSPEQSYDALETNEAAQDAAQS